MSLVKLSNEILSIHGRFAGMYFKKDNSGQHLQAWPRVWHYTRSPAQMGVSGLSGAGTNHGISGFSTLSVLWHMALLIFFLGLWTAFAAANYFITKKGDERKMTNWDWFVHWGMFPEESDRAPFWKPPHARNELPNFVVLYKGYKAYGTAPPEWDDLTTTGYYWHKGIYNRHPYYAADDVSYVLWNNNTTWVLSPLLGLETPGMTSYSQTGDINAYYLNPDTHIRTNVYWGNSEERLLPH